MWNGFVIIGTSLFVLKSLFLKLYAIEEVVLKCEYLYFMSY